MYIMFIRCHPPYRIIPPGPLVPGERPFPHSLGEKWKLRHNEQQNWDLGQVPSPKPVSMALLTQLAMPPLSTLGQG